MKRLLPLLLILASPAHAFDLQGHRGARGLAPENTLPAFATALRLGVTTLEFDLAMTKDGVLVVHHDPTLNPNIARGPDGQYITTRTPLRDLTLDEVKRYDVGRLKADSGYGKTHPEQKPVDGTRIPTLSEVVAFVERAGAKDVRFNIETKLSPTTDAETADPATFARAIADAIRNAGLTERATVQSFDWRTLKILRELAPEIRRVCLTVEAPTFDTVQRGKPGASPWLAGLDIDDFDHSVPKLAHAAGCAVWSPNYREVTGDSIAAAKVLGIQVIPWTVNDRSEMARLIDLGVDGIISDYPDRLRGVMAEKSLPLPPPFAVD
ncbi:glycerophosphoryl diester phosphodiesterase precursor [Variibacter gotjawalensis]|uniref:Glycerophosphoryl diester phosphodiesterase n=1 Tax=Variibacter gotjawalensis TaxID=1333996 RepID=A0A0S3PVP0_9BRAD|nr:glycerophosphodiester phosphodiesterase [Variibacter gotjawalensis]NIK45833.1 glycerophosphoryl diester phosphodiesterase [Variibacter gotjawalensis]RZS47757.1 glycerophosphoryl diester phosphodiesterase [Variibacter gotjawalensis]BAT60011.1 glycerophosphoryl diester phosphodiesterase precursor [Variibacter gotjawalensis]